MNIRKKSGLEIYIEFSNLMDKTTFKDKIKYKNLETDFKEVSVICNDLKNNFNKFKRLYDGDLETAYEMLKAENEKLEAENEKLEAENRKLKKERDELVDTYWKLQEAEKLIEKLKKENEELKRSNNTLKKLLRDLYKELKNKKIIKQTIEIFTI